MVVSPTLLISTPVQVTATLVLAHGAGQGMRGAFLETVSQGLTDLGWRVVRFDFPYMSRRALTGRRSLPDRLPVLLDAYRSAVEALNQDAQTHPPLDWRKINGRPNSVLLG